jgi:hypothetical protein
MKIQIAAPAAVIAAAGKVSEDLIARGSDPLHFNKERVLRR